MWLHRERSHVPNIPRIPHIATSFLPPGRSPDSSLCLCWHQKRGAGTAHYFCAGVVVLAPHWPLMTRQGDGMQLILAGSGGHLASPQGKALIPTTWERWGTSWQPHEGDGSASHLPLLVRVGLEPHFFLWLFTSFQAHQAAPFWVLWLQTAGFCWGSFLCTIWWCWVSGFFSSQSGV